MYSITIKLVHLEYSLEINEDYTINRYDSDFISCTLGYKRWLAINELKTINHFL